MPVVLTDAYKNRTFILPFTADKSECAYVKPLTETDIDKIRKQAAKEGGADEVLITRYFNRAYLMESITGWQGFYDAAGNEIPYSPEMVKEICECDPAFAFETLRRVRDIARLGELDERKN